MDAKKSKKFMLGYIAANVVIVAIVLYFGVKVVMYGNTDVPDRIVYGSIFAGLLVVAFYLTLSFLNSSYEKDGKVHNENGTFSRADFLNFFGLSKK